MLNRTFRWTLLPLTVVLCTAVPKFSAAVDLLSENFEGVTLMPIVTFESELRSREAWQTIDNGPTGWSEINNTTSVGDTESGVLEFEGWRYVDKEWWINTAGDQERSQFLNGVGTILVADPDEWDDFGSPAQGSEGDLLPENGVFDSTLVTPVIPISGITEAIKLAFSSSWRPEDHQTATLTARYNNGSEELDVWTSQTSDSNYKDDATNEQLLYELQSIPAGATSVQFEFRLQGNNDWWWAIDNLSVFTGDNPGEDGVLRAIIDRATGEVRVVNNTGATVDLRGYSIRSTAGAFDEGGATFLSGSDSDWIQATQVGGSENDLSEVHVDSYAFGTTDEINFGQGVWLGYFEETSDITFNYLIDGYDEQLLGIVEFTGSPVEGYEFLDLNFDGAIDVLDWDAFRAGYGVSLTGLTQAVGYSLGDIDFDGKHTLNDFVEFQRQFDLQLGAGAFAAMLSGRSVPEPSTWILGSLAMIGFVVVRHRQRLQRGFGFAVALCGLWLVAQPANAQLTLLYEDFESVTLMPFEEENGSGDVWTNVAPTGWTTDNSGVPGTVADLPGVSEVDGDDPTTMSDSDGVSDWSNWAFVNKDAWVTAAGDQDRSLFTRGTGNVMVADPDEWDDADATLRDYVATNAAGGTDYYDVFARTPVIQIPAGIPAGRITLSFDSSWNPEGFDDLDNKNNQSAYVRAYYDSDSPIDIVHWDSDDEGNFYKPKAVSERVSYDLEYDGTSSTLQLEFALQQSWNDWWWAIDNVLISVPTDPLALRINTATGQAYIAGQDSIASSLNGIDISSESGQLQVVLNGGLANAIDDAVDGPLDTDSIAGNMTGEYWELLASTNEKFAEAFLYGSSSFDSSRSEYLGRLLSGLPADPTAAAAASDLVFTYALATGDIVTGIVEFYYEEPTNMPGDFNQDGVVDLADYTVWRNNLGAAADGGLNGNGDGLGVVDAADYAIWKDNFGVMYGSQQSFESAAVPEPATYVSLLLLAAVGVVLRSRKALSYGLSMVVVFAVTAIATCANAALPPSPFVDRDYGFGDDDSSVVIGQYVSQQDTQGNYITYDGAGDSGANQLIDLIAVTTTSRRATYVSTADRPDGNGGVGIQLNSLAFDRQYLRTGFGEALNNPEQSPSSLASLLNPGGTLNYYHINDRGFELWAKPTAVSGEQHIVMDSQQHGVLINSEGNFSMRYASKYEVETTQLPGPDEVLGTADDILQVSDPIITPANYDTDVAAVAGQWYHLAVVRGSGPNNGSILYINGVAESIGFGEYAVETIVNEGEGEVFTNIDSLDQSPLTVGRATTNNASFGVPAGEEYYFRGVVDDLSMFVMGLNDNDNVNGGGDNQLNDWGEYVFQRDNGYAQAFAPDVDGDLNGDDLVNLADAALFASNWLFEKRMTSTDPFTDEVYSRLVGDLSTRELGDFDYNGIVDLEDWAILNNMNPAAGAAALRMIQSGVMVPEPSTLLLGGLAVVAALVVRRNRTN